MAGITLLSSIPGQMFPRIDVPNADKGMHAILFLPLGWLMARAFAAGAHDRASLALKCALAALAVSFFGAVDEWHQILTPRRNCSLADWIVDTVAGAAGCALYFAWAIIHAHRTGT